MINCTIITTRKIYPRISLTLVRNNYFDSKQSLWFEEKKKPNSLLLPYYIIRSNFKIIFASRDLELHLCFVEPFATFFPWKRDTEFYRVRNNYFDSKQSLWFEEKKKPNSLLLPYYYSFKFQDHLRIARPRASPLLRRSIRYLFPLENVTPSFIESIPRRVFSNPREKSFRSERSFSVIFRDRSAARGGGQRNVKSIK